MAHKLINAAQARSGTAIVFEDIPCIVRSNDISKTGKHGHAKCRIEAISILDGKKKVFAMGGHDRLDVPLILKKKAQVLSVGEKANVMDLESFENFDISIPEDLKAEVGEGDQVEYWDVEGLMVVKKKL